MATETHGDTPASPAGRSPGRRAGRRFPSRSESLDSAASAPTIASYFRAFSPAPPWDQVCAWPPDAFALCNLVLDHTEAYRFAVAPPQGQAWPPLPDWNQRVAEAAQAWRHGLGTGRGEPPRFVAEQWEVITRARHLPMTEIRRGDDEGVWAALLTLHAIADEACQSLADAGSGATGGSLEQRAWQLMAEHGSLSRLSPARIRIVPKTHFSPRGMTIRSLSRYLALSYEAVEVRWSRVESEIESYGAGLDSREYNVLLVPWPLSVDAQAFRRVEAPLANMDDQAFGFFEFAPVAPLDVLQLARLLDVASRHARVDAVILPEAAVDAAEIAAIEEVLARKEVTFLFAGVRERATTWSLGRNYLHLGVLTGDRWERFEQSKHHRWCLDESQIGQYHLSRSLDPKRQWWEAISLAERTLQVIDVGGGATTAALICEDLARMDEVADLLRRLGPTAVVAVLLDGPQLAGRWPCRYASVLADDPGSAVLTLTSLGMASRSKPPGKARSRIVAMWNDPTSGLHEIELGRGASGVLITASAGEKSVWTADGRAHRHTPELVLTDVRQLRVPSPVS